MNKLYRLIACWFCFAVTVEAAGLSGWNMLIEGASPLHWYKFDEASGTNCLDSGSGAMSGTYDGVSIAQEGMLESGQAVLFSGTGANRITFGSAGDLSGDWTAEYIVKKLGASTQCLHDSSALSLRLVQWNSDEVGFTKYGTADYKFTALPGHSLVIPSDEWVHLVFRRISGTGTQVFVNGLQVGSTSSSIDCPRDQIGAHLSGADPLNACLDEAVIYGRALSDQEIQQHSDVVYSYLVPDDFDSYSDNSALASVWTIGSGSLLLETTQTHGGTLQSMRIDYAGGAVITKDLSETFDYSSFDGKDLVLWFMGDFSNMPGDVVFRVIDDSSHVVDSLTLTNAATRDRWSMIGVKVDTTASPNWNRVRQIQIEVTGSGTLYVDSLAYDNRSSAITGDLNLDSGVDMADLLLLIEQWMDANCFGYGCGDLDQTGGVGLSDLALLAENWGYESQTLVISEFMAANSYIPATNPTDIYTLVDGAKDHPDWIELHNPDSEGSVSLEGWYLTDDAGNLTKWRFPAAMIEPGGYRVIWASRKTAEEHPGNYPYIDDRGDLHTNFKLSQDGEYLALVRPDGVTIAQQFNKYPKQRGLISYGIDPADRQGFLLTPTPGIENSSAWLGEVADTKFNIDRGFYESPIDVTISCQTEGATIRYTLDASTPTLTNGITYTSGNPIHIDSTSCLRAAAFKAGWLSSDVDTQTYLFLDDVIVQSPNGETPPGWPSSSVNGQVFEYGMDPDITGSAEYGAQMRDALTQIDSISLVTDFEHLTSPSSGIYVNATMEGVLWERPVSAELIRRDGSKGFQANAGFRIRGAYSRTDSNPKHSFRLLFKSGYGPGELKYPVFDNEGVDEFDNLDLRTAQNYAWSNWGNDGSRNTIIRDVYSRDLQRAMGRPYTRSRYYHLYLNGQYWGIYQSQERSEASYAESYLGGYSEYYDVIKTDSYRTSFTDGSLDQWNALWHLCEAGFETDEKYYAVLGKDANGNDDPSLPVHVDVDNLIDYMLDIFFAGNQDAPITLSGTSANNFYAIRDRRPQRRQGWVFFAYDSEHSMLSATIDRTAWFSAGSQIGHFNPQWLHQKLMSHPEYRMRFADRAHKHFFNDGAMTTDNATALLLNRAAEYNTAIIAESARWGDHRSDRLDNPYTQAHWWAEINGFLVNTYLSGRTQTVLNQLKNRQLYPTVEAPAFNQHGGYVSPGFDCTMSAPAGTIYYTLDGSDPRLPGGSLNPQALEYASGEPIQQTILPRGSQWKYFDTGTDPGIDWMNAGYDDTGWAAGHAELGYGDGGTEVTQVGYIDTDPETNGDQKNAATYFRKTLNLTNVSSISSLTLRLRRDDGAIVYINGQEVRRDNMNPGPASYLTWANATVGGANESTYFDSSVDPTVLIEGDNLIAVEVHQTHATSSDISFDLELVALSQSESSTLQLNETTDIKTRTLDNGVWSALNEAVFAVGPVAESLRISEMMFHPQNDPNAEFLEFQNIGTEAINLKFVELTKGVDFTFPSLSLPPGGHVVVVRDETAFDIAYPEFAGIIAGTWESGDALNDGGEKVRLKDALGTVIHDFDYKDGWYELADGMGFSLTMVDPAAADPNLWDAKAGWRSSLYAGGTPGAAAETVLAADSIVVNELLAHSHAENPDWVELYNTTAQDINIGGWFLSDNDSDDPNIMKYRIPDGTVIEAGDYYVFVEDQTFGNPAAPGCNIPFGLSEAGETVYLYSGQNDQVSGYYQAQQKFDASETGVTFGRYEKAELSGGYDFVRQMSQTQGTANSGPTIPDIVITEIHYNPSNGTDYEFVELYNRSGSPVTLMAGVTTEVTPGNFITETLPWRLEGTGFEFPANTTIPANTYILVAKKPAMYSSAPCTVYGPYDGKLDNGGEEIELQIPGDQEYGQNRYWIPIEKIDYDDKAPWPTTPDGQGDSLQRQNKNTYGRDHSNWQAAPPTAGSSS